MKQTKRKYNRRATIIVSQAIAKNQLQAAVETLGVKAVKKVLRQSLKKQSRTLARQAKTLAREAASFN